MKLDNHDPLFYQALSMSTCYLYLLLLQCYDIVYFGASHMSFSTNQVIDFDLE